MKKLMIHLFIGILFLLPQRLGAQWMQTNGPEGRIVWCFAVSDNNIFASIDTSVYLSMNNGTSWTKVNSVSPEALAVYSLFASGTNIFAGTMWHGVFLSTNNGTSWTASNSGLFYSTGIMSPLFFTVYSLAASGSNIFAVINGTGIFLSTNNGTNWNAINNGLPVTFNPGEPEHSQIYTSSLAVSGNNIFTGTDSGVYLSTNNGTNWTAVNSGLTNMNVNTLLASGGSIFAGTDSGVYLSTNNGTNWTAVNSGLTNMNVNTLLASGGSIFAGTDSGVYLSTNNGTNWTAVNSGLTNLNINTLIVSGSTIFAGTGGSGVWYRPLSEIIGVLSKSFNKPQNLSFFKLAVSSQSNQNIVISFSLLYKERVSLKMYNFSGSEISTLVNLDFGSGSHTLNLDTRNITAGCYTVKMQAGQDSYVKSILIFR